MALMNTLRNKLGTVVVTMIAISILAFVLTDLLSNNSVFFGARDKTVGEIAGEEVDIDEYRNLVEKFKINYRNQFGRSPNEAEMRSIRDQAWQYLIIEKAFTKLYNEAGVEVGAEELYDMVQGNNISPELQQIFTNPQTGQFDKLRLQQTIAQMAENPEDRARWIEFEQSLIPGRLRIKYENLLVKTSFATTPEAEREYKEQNSVAEAKYLYVPFFVIPDSTIEVSDSELEDYISRHKDEYKVDWSRSLKYVVFPVVPSSEDSLAYRDELRGLIDEFKVADNDSVYASVMTEEDPYYQDYAIHELPDVLRSNLNILKEGDVIGPYLDGGDYVLFKISAIKEGDKAYARASHILVKWSEDTPEAKAKARNKALAIIRELQAGADFAEVAKDKSDDGGSAINGGDLGWFDEDRMVEPFSKAVFGATTEGLIARPVESEFGYHIINVTGAPRRTRYTLAMVRKLIVPSDETRNEAYRKADYFAGTTKDMEDFEANAKRDSLLIREAEGIGPNDYNIPQLGEARQIVSWLFNTADEGVVSDVFDLNDKYVVAVMTGEVEEGTADLEDVRLEVEKKVIDEKKAAQLIERLAALSGTLEERAKEFGDDASIYENSDIKLSAYSLPSVGTAPEAIGTLFAMQNEAISKPVKTENGVVVLKLLSLTEPPEIGDYSLYKASLERTLQNRTSFYVNEAIKEWADIEDERYKFY